jgi:hypothetical protein
MKQARMCIIADGNDTHSRLFHDNFSFRKMLFYGTIATILMNRFISLDIKHT